MHRHQQHMLFLAEPQQSSAQQWSLALNQTADVLPLPLCAVPSRLPAATLVRSVIGNSELSRRMDELLRLAIADSEGGAQCFMAAHHFR